MIVPVNGYGMGLGFFDLNSGDASTRAKSKEKAIILRESYAEPGIPSIPSDIPIDNRHLIRETYIVTFHISPLKIAPENTLETIPQRPSHPPKTHHR